jgi:acyl-coenzyme A synthetase/AMP-(fatty) acid ligase
LHALPSVIAMMGRLGQLSECSLPSLRVSIFGGEGAPVSALRAWQAAAPNSIIENQYGPTESTVACFSQRFTEPPIETPGRGTLAIGVPFRGTHAAIVDDRQQFLGADQIGELALCGPQLAAGYLNDETRTADRFRMLIHPALGATRWYLTGDSAFVDAAGRFHCLGRLDHQVKVMGHRVDLEEIEAHLRAICSSEAVAAIPWPDNQGSAAGIVAFVAGARIAPPVVREQLRDRMPIYMAPSKVMALESMPRLAGGAVDREALRGLLNEGAFAS